MKNDEKIIFFVMLTGIAASAQRTTADSSSKYNCDFLRTISILAGIYIVKTRINQRFISRFNNTSSVSHCFFIFNLLFL
jgi:hypothetical protein